MKKKLFSFLFVLLSFSLLISESRKSEDVFKKWIKIQRVFDRSDFNQIKDGLKESDFIALKSRYASILNFLQTYSSFFSLASEKQIENGLLKLSILDDDLIKQKFEKIYRILYEDPQRFVDFLKEKYLDNDNLSSLDNFFKSSFGVSDSDFIDECRDLFFLLFSTDNFVDIEKRFFTVGNNFFDYCFRIKTWPNFRPMLLDEKQHLIAKFLYSIIWRSLAGNGWKHWSSECLKKIKDRVCDGCEVVYIAGGSDIFQLTNTFIQSDELKNVIYKIKIIDPLLPTQPKYYSEGWDWLIKGQDDDGIGDEIIFNLDNKKVIMKRKSFKLLGNKFKARVASGDIIDIDQSETIWETYDSTNNRKIGEFKIERRFAGQSDFTNDKKKAIVISFNELYFIATPEAKGGWGTNPYKFPDYMYFYVKQLHKPVSVKVVRNLRSACEQMEFNYIALGTCIN
ncbi:hypothetical protein ACFLYH_01225 [Candidatus Dependentiae bacterium]